CSVGSPPSASATTARSWPRPSAGATSPCPAGSPDPPAARPSTSPPDGPGSATSTTPSPGSASSQRLRDRPPGPPSSAGPPAPKHPARKRVPRNPLGARSVTPQHLYGRQRPTEVTSPTQDPWKSANGGSRLNPPPPTGDHTAGAVRSLCDVDRCRHSLARPAGQAHARGGPR